MASGNGIVVGSYLGTGAAQYIRYDKVGFKPTRLTIYRYSTAYDKAEHLAGMADASFLKTNGADGVRSLVSTEGVTLQSSGFLLGTDASVNNSGDTYRFCAEE